MPAIQSTYTPILTVAYAGMIVDMRSRTVLSREIGGTAAMAFGSVAMRGTTDHTMLPLGATGAGMFLGIVTMDPTIRAQVAATNGFGVGDTGAVLIKGAVWVTVTAAVTPGTPAFYDAGGNLTGVSAGNTAIPNATFETTAAANGVAALRL